VLNNRGNGDYMIKCIIGAAKCAIIILLVSMSLSGAGDWQLVKSEKQINVYSRPVAGFPLNEFRGNCMIDASLEVIENVMTDFNDYKNWFAMCRKVRIIEKKYGKNFVVHYIVASPWPIADRDSEVSVNVDFNMKGGMGAVVLKSLNTGRIPESKNLVRINSLDAEFVFKRIAPDKTAVVLKMKVDPLIDLSYSFQNNFLESYPLDTLRGLREIAAARRGSIPE